MPGFNWSEALREKLGNGRALSQQELKARLDAAASVSPEAMTRSEFEQFFGQSGMGGPWLCEVLAAALWKVLEARVPGEVPEPVSTEILATLVANAMVSGRAAADGVRATENQAEQQLEAAAGDHQAGSTPPNPVEPTKPDTQPAPARKAAPRRAKPRRPGPRK